MELTLRGRGIVLRDLRDQVEEKTGRLVKVVYRWRSSERHLEHQKELVEASATRYVPPIVEPNCGRMSRQELSSRPIDDATSS